MSDTNTPASTPAPTEPDVNVNPVEELQLKLDEAVKAKEVAEKERDEAVKRAEAAEKKAQKADPKKMKADYEVGMNYDQLAEKYNLKVKEVAKIIGA